MPITSMIGTIALIVLVGILFMNAIARLVDGIHPGAQVVAISTALMVYAVACIKFAIPIYLFILL